jgi:hypothetical protein
MRQEAPVRLTQQTVFWPATQPGALIYGDSGYTRPTGVEKQCRRAVETKNDLIDAFEVGFSDDNGRTWSPLQPTPVYAVLPQGGTLRRHILPSFVDPVNGRLLTTYNEAHMAQDDALHDGMTATYLCYRVSLDGGRTIAHDQRIVQQGYSPAQPMRGVTVGKNAVMLGDNGSETIRTRGGRLLVPVQICPVGPDGEYINPGGGYTYHEAAVLIGRWSPDPADLAITWDLSSSITNDPARSTRGAVEPTIAQLPDGRLLMVLRGSNGGKQDVDCQLPSYRWYTTSSDEGDSWAPVQPWTYHDGGPFFSPSSMSQLLPHPNGQLYWLGNISAANCRGNSPRYPILVGRVDPDSLLLRRDSLFVIDDRRPGEDAGMTLSNFHAHVDRVTGEIILHLSRWLTRGPGDWTAPALQYRIAVD